MFSHSRREIGFLLFYYQSQNKIAINRQTFFSLWYNFSIFNFLVILYFYGFRVCVSRPSLKFFRETFHRHSARKRPIPYHRPTPTPPSSPSSSRHSNCSSTRHRSSCSASRSSSYTRWDTRCVRKMFPDLGEARLFLLIH